MTTRFSCKNFNVHCNFECSSFFTVNGRQREVTVWCYQSEGLNKFDHLEVVVMLEVRKKEDIFPEEVLRIYRGILHLAAKLGTFKTSCCVGYFTSCSEIH